MISASHPTVEDTMGDDKTPSFAIVGAGGLGSYVGAKLALAGYPTLFCVEETGH